ncbi:MAG: D-hexose-6-phosphate mutarotase [Planctomycetia bacterium]|nr:D-hexose-6-phosphate mutarotase [Planctomycetia bacterium]
MNFNQLAEYEIADELWFVEIEHGFTYIEINNSKAHATISTYSGQVLSYRPTGQQHDLLFVSEQAYYQDGRAIKGGIPVCWPWFGADPEDRGRPAHGFVRNRQWTTSASESLADGSTRVVLSLVDNDETRAIWPHRFRLDIEITVGDSLKVALVTHNRGDEGITISQALHSYFQVGDISRVRVLGLDSTDYLDKVDDSARKTQSGAVTIEGEVDRIYTGVTGELVIEDDSLGRNIQITSTGSSTTVVWNPWIEVATSMADLGDDDYRKMLCVETANAGPETVAIASGDEYRLEAEFTLTAKP